MFVQRQHRNPRYFMDLRGQSEAVAICIVCGEPAQRKFHAFLDTAVESIGENPLTDGIAAQDKLRALWRD